MSTEVTVRHVTESEQAVKWTGMSHRASGQCFRQVCCTVRAGSALAHPTFHYWAPVGVSCRERITSSTVTGTLPAARWMSMALIAGQCHTLYMMPTRLHRTRSAASSCTCIQRASNRSKCVGHTSLVLDVYAA
jgi:hypothetical protein